MTGKEKIVRRTTRALALLTSLSVASPIQPLERPKIELSEKVQEAFMYYFRNRPNEFIMSLEGEFEDNTYFIEDIKVPFIQYSAPDTLLAGMTNENYHSDKYLGMVHQHLSGDCTPGVTDMKRFLKDKLADLEIIVCGMNQDSTNASVKWNVYVKPFVEDLMRLRIALEEPNKKP